MKTSKGEEKIISLLKQGKYKFEREKRFKDLKHGMYRFDFYVVGGLLLPRGVHGSTRARPQKN